MKLKNLLFIATFLATFCGISACDSIYETVKPIKGDGNITTQTRTAEGFSEIELEGFADVNVYPGESYKVTVRTDANLQEQIVIETENNALLISNKDGSISPTELTVDVYLPALQKAEITGSGDIKINSGKAINVELYVTGSGNIDAASFQVDTATVKIEGSGNVNVCATKLLQGEVEGSGNIDAQTAETELVEIKVFGSGEAKVSATKLLKCEVEGSGNIDAQKTETESAEIKLFGSGGAKVWITKTLNGEVSGSGNIYYKGKPTVAVEVTGTGSVEPL